ncbi:hypothetical protein Ahy_B05g076092 [Arachis hypogaea]|uniref:Transposase MuDR plant domain-containing protein n=1 Tax=Arachis hypogaea TaxID=3818 RepID=A0A444Z2L9_ARAHY|nr:hypothetical protein Ahy_B05g076092 [Arachis hypogaea]
MASEESFVVLVHHRGSIKRKTRFCVKFTDKDPLCIIVRPTTSYDDLVRSVLMKLGLEGAKRVKKFFYRIPITVLQKTVKYDCFTIGSDEDLQVMFHCRRQFPKVRTPELLAKLVDVVSSSGDSNRNTTTLATASGSSSRPSVASSSVPTYEPPVQPVASPSFAVDLNGSVGDEVGTGKFLPTSFTVRCTAWGWRRIGVSGQPIGFGARDAEGSVGLTEFQVGQQFQDKYKALLSVKTYSIHRGVQYKVVESDYRRYVGKCFEFGNGCTWLIRLSLRQRKGIWVYKYGTYLSSSRMPSCRRMLLMHHCGCALHAPHY